MSSDFMIFIIVLWFGPEQLICTDAVDLRQLQRRLSQSQAEQESPLAVT